jgi:hypothetical protein
MRQGAATEQRQSEHRASGHASRLAAVWRGLLEALLCLAGYVLYSLLRGVVAVDPATAASHARQIIGLERALHLFREPSLQGWMLGIPGSARLWNGIYLWMHTPLVIFTLVYLYLRHRPTYPVIRNVFFISAAIGLLCFAFYPTAPPRLMPGYGFTDTIATAARNAPDVRPGAFENAYAAVPSLHVGWAFMIALAFWWTARHWIVRVLAVIEAVGMGAAVVFTANHYFLDGALGIAVVLVALGVTRAMQQRVMSSE